MLTRVLMGVALTFTSGCSLAFVDGPPDFIPANEPVPPESCTIERALPFLDAVGAGAFLVTALTSSDGDNVRFAAVGSGALGFSSYTGFRRVKQCRERMFQMLETPSPDTLFPRALIEIADPLLGAPRLLRVNDGSPDRSR